jgi:hypothetical protein
VTASIFANAAPPALDRQRPTLVRKRLPFHGRLGRNGGEARERDVGQHANHKVGERAFVHADVIGWYYRRI